MKALDIDAVRAFVFVADLRSFTRAAEALDTTQPAVSVKLRKLEDRLGRRLLERSPRDVRLSAEGLAFLAPARELVAAHARATDAFGVDQRRLVVGVNQHLVGGELPVLLRRLRDQDSSLRVEMRVEGTTELLRAFEAGELDAALVLRPDDRRKRGRVVYAAPFSWFAAPGWRAVPGQPLPLATQGGACRVRAAALRALDADGIAWEEAFIGKGAAVVGAAAAAGLAIAVLAEHAAPSGTVDVAADLGLPPIPAQDVMLYSALNDARSRAALRTLTLAFQRMR